jgi:hypothetical protein
VTFDGNRWMEFSLCTGPQPGSGIKTLERKTTMIVRVDPNDSRAVRNKDNVLALYELMINQKKSEEGTAKFR